MTPLKLSKLLLEHLQFGGVTLSTRGKVITEGIVVAQYPDTEQIIRWRPDIEQLLLTWVWSLKKKSALGLWVDHDHKIYLDQVKIFPQHQIKEAVELGLANKQKAIQLLNPNTTLRLG